MNLTIDYLKDRYDEEQLRFDHFENKCSKILTFVSVIIGAVAALASIKFGETFQPRSTLAWLTLYIFIFGLFSICCSWGHSLQALRIGDCPVMPRSRATMDYLTAVGEELQIKHIYNCYVDTLEKLSVVIDDKSKALELAYQELNISAWLLSIAAALTIYTELSK